MSRSVLEDAFAHHVWATLRTLDACLALSPEQLDTTVPGTYGSILATARHLVGADCWYLFDMTGESSFRIEDESMDLEDLKTAIGNSGPAWAQLLAANPNPDTDVVEIDDEAAEFHATMGIRLAQALHHGTDHRSQICTALTTLGVEPPAIDVWDFGEQAGSVFDAPPSS
jgi:uncharacterized damage-inducible protein DinB